MFYVELAACLVVAALCGLVAQWREATRSAGGFLLVFAVGFVGAVGCAIAAGAIGIPDLLPLRLGGWAIPVLWPVVGATLATIGVTSLPPSAVWSGRGPGVRPGRASFRTAGARVWRRDAAGAAIGQWLRFEGEARRRWARLTDADLRQVGQSLTKLAHRIHERYGDSMETVTQQLKQLMLRFREQAVPRPG